jgi:raffinose/stachyose/melibiose transport system permease protein
MSSVIGLRGPDVAEAPSEIRVRDASRPHRRVRARSQRVAYIYLAPVLLVYTAFLLLPLAHSALISFFRWDGETSATWVGLRNYIDAVRDPVLRGAFLHSLTLIVFYAVIPVTIALLLTGVMARAPRLRFLSGFRVILFLPQVVASVVVAIVWSAVYASTGPLNSVLNALGLHSLSNSQGWLGDFSTALPSVGVIGTWTEIGLCLILLLAGIAQIPTELYDAARIDGAGALAEFFAVTLPGIRRQLVIALVLTVTAALRNFDVIYVATGGGPGYQTTVPSWEVYNQAFLNNEVGSASAIGIILLLIIALLVFIITRFDTKS